MFRSVLSSVLTHRVSVNNGEIYLQVSGSGPALVLLPGHTLDSTLWTPNLAALEPAFTLLRLDLRGYGKSSFPKENSSHAEDVLAVLDYLDLERAHLLGLSLGGNVALDVAYRAPHRTARVVLAAPSLKGFALPLDFTTSLERLGILARTQGVEAAHAAWRAHPLFASTPTAVLEGLAGGYTGEHWLRTLPPSTWIDAGVFNTLERIEAPTRVLIGEHDLPHNLEIARMLTQRLPHGLLEVIAGAGHLLNVDQPERFALAVLEHLKAE